MKRLIIFALSFVLLTSFSAVKVSAEDAVLSDQQIDHIKANCVTVKNTLNQLHASDALLRVNRGQLYESIGTKLMERFTNRVNHNAIDNQGLTFVTGEYQKALNSFRTNYSNYEKTLSVAIDTNCKVNPKDFYHSTQKARSLRLIVHDDTVKLNNLIDNYNQEFLKIKTKVLGGGL